MSQTSSPSLSTISSPSLGSTSPTQMSRIHPGLPHHRTIHGAAKLDFRQVSETDRATMIIMHEPTIESFIASLHPMGSLYETSTTRGMIKESFKQMITALTNNGVVVKKVREILLLDVETNEKYRRQLESLASEGFSYRLENESQREQLSNEELYLLSDVYKNQVLSKLTPDDLVDIVLTRPVVKLSKSLINTPLTVTCVEKHPVGNLVFCRDQQITTAKGVISGKLNSRQREYETRIMRCVFEKLGCSIIGQITGEGRLEGGDFFPVSADLAMLGIGLRTNRIAANYLMDNDLLGTRRFAIVRDDFDLHQDRMHLDTVFNIVSDKFVVALEDILGMDSPIRRIVEEYVKNPATGKYELKREVEFEEFLLGEGYTIVQATDEEQKKYFINFLNIGEGRLIAVHDKLADRLREAGYTGKVEYVNFVGVTNMFGAAHCATQVCRVPLTPPEGASRV